MTIAEWLATTTTTFKDAQLDSARLDAEILLAYALKVNRIWLHANNALILTPLKTPQIAKGPSSSSLVAVKNARGRTLSKKDFVVLDIVALDKLVKRRLAHEPIAYIVGKQEFYGRDFLVSPDTLTPRPETETLVALAVQAIAEDALPHGQLAIIDVGTGSGCIAISVALELHKKGVNRCDYYAIDNSEAALTIARENAQTFNANIEFSNLDIRKHSVLEILHKKYSGLYILANLPYVPNTFHINTAATHEPPQAIFGGDDGLDLYRNLCAQLTHAQLPISLFTESLPMQHEAVTAIAHQNGLQLQTTTDFIQVFAKS